MSILLSRRRFLQTTLGGITLVAGGLPLRLARAASAGDKRLVVVILRGAIDGLAAVVPYGDPSYADARGVMRLPLDDSAMVRLDAYFAMHTALAPLAQMYAEKELLVLHACATPYRDRSHFDAQNLLENGGVKPHAISTGWLNRATLVLQDAHEPIAIGPTVPLLLRGQAKVNSWAPSILPSVDSDFLTRVAQMYESDPLLHEAISGTDITQPDSMEGGLRGPRAFPGLMQKTALFLGGESGARIATVELGGWDSHANQGLETGRLANNMAQLAEGLAAFKQAMGTAWNETAVLVITEFGRTVQGNGSGGTDHGTASVAFLLGGSVQGGRVLGDWPGLAQLYQGRDLMPANDLRSLLKGTLEQHMGIDEAMLSSDIFPQSASVRGLPGLFARS